MPDTSVGVVSMGLRLEEDDFLKSVKAVGSKAAAILRNMLGTALQSKAIDLSGVEKAMSNATQNAVKNGMSGAAKAINSFKMPKITVDYDKGQLEQMLRIYNDRWKAIDDQRIIQARKVAQARESAAQAYDKTKAEEVLSREEKKLQDLRLAAFQADAQAYQLQMTLENMGAGTGPEAAAVATGDAGIAASEAGFQAEEAGRKAEEAGERAKEAGNKSEEAGWQAEEAGERAKIGAEKASRASGGLSSALSKAKMHLGKFIRIGLGMMGIQTAMRALRKLTQSVGQSFQVMAAQNASFASSLNGISQAAGTMKGAFAAAVAPLVSALIPALQTVIGWATKAFNALALFFGALTGKKKVMIAVGSTEKFTKSMSGVGGGAKKAAKGMKNATKAAEKYKRTLAGFDELEIIDTEKDEDHGGGDGGIGDHGGGGAGGAGTAGPIFKEVSTGLGDFQNKLKELFDGIANTKAFEILKTSALRAWDEITRSASKAAERISASWEKNGPRIGKALLGIAKDAGNAGARVLGYVVIPAMAGGISAAITIGAAFVDNLLGAIATGLEAAEAVFKPFFNSVTQFFDAHGQEISNLIYDTWNGIAEGVSVILDGIGLLFDAVFGGIRDWFTAHSSEIQEMWTETWETIWNFIEPLWNLILEVGTSIFGALKDFFEEVAPKIQRVVTSAMELMWTIIQPIWTAMLIVAKAIFGALQGFWEEWGEDITNIFSTAWDIITDVFGTALDVIADIFDVFTALFSGDWEGAWNGILKTGERIWGLLQRTFDRVIGAISRIFEHFGVNIGDVWENIKGIFQGIIDFITGVFSGDWEKAWTGVKNIFKNIIDALVSIFKIPINGIIRLINAFIRGLNKIRIPDWVPGIGGKGINISQIPLLAKGGIIDQPTLSVIGERGKEAVVPLENNTAWLDKMAGKIAAAIQGQRGEAGGDIQITIPVYLGNDSLVSVIEKTIKREEILRNAPIF